MRIWVSLSVSPNLKNQLIGIVLARSNCPVENGLSVLDPEEAFSRMILLKDAHLLDIEVRLFGAVSRDPWFSLSKNRDWDGFPGPLIFYAGIRAKEQVPFEFIRPFLTRHTVICPERYTESQSVNGAGEFCGGKYSF